MDKKSNGALGMIAPVAGSVINTGLGMIIGRQMRKDANKNQIDQQRELNKLGVDMFKDTADYNYQKQLQMWRDTNYSAQREEMIKAGLNPALMYGMGGGGGSTTGSGSGQIATSQADGAAATAETQMGMGMQLAQMQLMKAQAEKTEAETEKIQGVDTEQAKAQTGLLNTTNELQKVQEYVSRNTQQEAIEKIIGESRSAIENATKDIADAKVARQTVDERIELLKTEIHKTMNEGDNAVRQGQIQEAEIIIKRFEAELTKQGIAPNSPWYVKIISDMLNGLGLGIKPSVKAVKEVTK